jgi:hypothetical protein
MKLSKQQLLSFLAAVYLVLPVLFFSIGRYFKSEAFLAQYRLAPMLQHGTLKIVAIVLIYSCLVAVLYFLWTVLVRWTTAQKTVISILLFLFPLVVGIVLGLAFLEIKIGEAKEKELIVQPIPNSNKTLHVWVLEKSRFFKDKPEFKKTLLFTHQRYSPLMHKLGEYECVVSDIKSGTSSLQVVFESATIEESDSLLNCKLVVVY